MARPIHPPVIIPADTETDYVYPPPRLIRPTGLAVTVWSTRLLGAVALVLAGRDAYHIVRTIWTSVAARTIPLSSSLLPSWWTIAAGLATATVFIIGWYACGDQNEGPSETLRRVRSQPDVEHWAHQRG